MLNWMMMMTTMSQQVSIQYYPHLGNYEIKNTSKFYCFTNFSKSITYKILILPRLSKCSPQLDKISRKLEILCIPNTYFWISIIQKKVLQFICMRKYSKFLSRKARVSLFHIAVVAQNTKVTK